MKKSTILTVAAAVVVLAGLAFWRGASDGAGNQDRTAGSPGRAFSFSLIDYDGSSVSSADFAGTPLVVNSWATWCPFCVDELPDFAQVQDEFGDDVVFIAVNRSESAEQARGYSDGRLGLGDRLTFLLDPRDTFYRGIGGFAMPETVFVAVDGSIQFHKRGPMSLDEIRSRTQALLGS